MASPTRKHDANIESTLIADAATIQLEGAERVVLALTKEAQQAQETALAKMYALLAIDIVALGLVLVSARRNFVDPLRALAPQSLALARGDYCARVTFRSPDEIGQLALAFNQSAERIGELVADLGAAPSTWKSTGPAWKSTASPQPSALFSISPSASG